MSESADAPADALFRPSKRRKVFRKRNLDDDQEDTVVGNQPQKEPSPNNGGDHVNQSTNLSSVVRRPNAKKYGIGFGGSGNSAGMKEASSAENALVPRGSQVSAAAQVDRFVKPIGKAEVVEDKHLYVHVTSSLFLPISVLTA